ncbi:hypothetical protein [Microbacterium invictum]|uniref:Uncharacterized protein n=1 Tax=Microbacterium invictum TaxID=515415 RepID=A0AA40VMF2_9MICO|nr:MULTISPECIES: hypothetical protein [Microbacterium]MBB4139757.1 hypothetical protein [Microbacterium invictum]
MRKYLRKFAEMIAPTAYERLRRLSVLDADGGNTTDILLRYEQQVHDLSAQLDELRRENRRVVELYDLLFDRLHNENPLREAPRA